MVNGAEKAALAYDGRPTLDGGCVPDAADVLQGTFTPGATLTASRTTGGPGSATVATGTVTAAGDAYSAQFGDHGVRGAPFTITSSRVVSGVGFHVTLYDAVPCSEGTGPQTTVHPRITGRKHLTRVRVDRHGRFTLARRARCTKPLISCRVAVRAETRKGRSLGNLVTTVPGGSNRLVHGRLSRRGLAALHRTGRLPVDFSVVISPRKIPVGVHTVAVHTGTSGSLRA